MYFGRSEIGLLLVTCLCIVKDAYAVLLSISNLIGQERHRMDSTQNI